MKGSINKVILIGNVGNDVVITSFEDGNSIARFPLATTDGYTKKDTKEKVTSTDWHQIVVTNKLAPHLSTFLTKGDKVYIEGKLKTRSWNDEQGNKFKTTEIVANTVEKLNSLPTES